MTEQETRGRKRTEGFTDSELSGQGNDPALQRVYHQNNKERIKDKYHREKALGIRRSNGVPKLQKLRERHYDIIALHLEGNTTAQIARQTGFAYMTVWRVLTDELAQNLIAKAREGRMMDIEASMDTALQGAQEMASRKREDGTLNTDKTRLAAMDRIIKIAGHYKQEEKKADTEINLYVQGAREKLAGSLREIADYTEAEEAEYQEVEDGESNTQS